MALDDDPDLGVNHFPYRSRRRDSTLRCSRSGPAMPDTPPESEGDLPPLDVGANIDMLVQRLNRKPLLHDSLRWRFLDAEQGPANLEVEQIATHANPPVRPTHPLERTEHTPALSPIPEAVNAAFSRPTIQPLTNLTPSLYPSPPLQHDPTMPSHLACAITSQSEQQPRYIPPQPPLHPPGDSTATKSPDVKRLRRQTESRLHKSASNLRMLDLMSGMVENGVQCQIQTSTPPSPTRTYSTSSVTPLPVAMAFIEPQDPIDPEQLPTRMDLEVDLGFSEQDEETMLNETLALRHASTPAGIRKMGFLRYRSSTEAALQCKNMKKSTPRMRRRTRTNPPSTAASSTVDGPTSTTPMVA
ncbi:hypothetical protein GGR57DRAFT_228626 [Xylariaceae sp. FL1272]|nr:hypothetical protein GGR57DRAFT_228626 [Xylariaceae sp. FL1272]